MRIVHLERKYIPQIVNIHSRAFPDFFLTFLGARFLKEFYSFILKDENGISYIAVDDPGEIVLGVAVGPTCPAGFFKKLFSRRWWAFGLASLNAVMKNPSIIKRLLRAVKYRGDPPCHPGYALLSAIAVAPEIQGTRVGRSLLNAWVEEAKKRSCRGAYLLTDALDNVSANCFYQRAGWTLESTFITREGRTMNRYILSFNNEEP
jgi:GNAT superfamily N-acetyltransferase